MENEKKSSGLGIASLILGIISAVLCFIPILNWLCYVLGILALIFGIVSLAKKASKGASIAGVVLSIVSIVLTILLNSSIYSCSSTDDSTNYAVENTTSETKSNTTSTITSDNSTNSKSKEVKVGQSVSTDEVKITFVSAKDYTGYNSFTAPEKGNKIIRAEFKFENISNSDIYLDSFECYADDEKCEEYYYADDYESPSLESVSSGRKFTAVVYYEVPSSASNIALEYETNFWTDAKVQFIVK